MIDALDDRRRDALPAVRGTTMLRHWKPLITEVALAEALDRAVY